MLTRRALVLGAALLALSTGVATAAGPYPPPSTGSASVNPSRIKPGQCTTFSGNGMAPGAPVDVRDDGTAAGSTTASKAGSFRLRLCYGTDARTGQHVISGTGRSPEGPLRTVSAVLTITGVEQSAGSPGGTSSGAASGASTGGTSTGGTSTGTTTPGLGVAAPGAVAGDDLGVLPRTDTDGLSSAGDVAGSGFFDGLAGLGAFLGLLLALIASAWILLLLGRRRRRDEEDELQAQPA